MNKDEEFEIGDMVKATDSPGYWRETLWKITHIYGADDLYDISVKIIAANKEIITDRKNIIGRIFTVPSSSFRKATIKDFMEFNDKVWLKE